MKNASRGLSLAAIIVSAINLLLAFGHLLIVQSSQWQAIGVLIFAMGLLPLSLVLHSSLKKERRFRWTGLICLGILLALFFVSDTVAEILWKTQPSSMVENPTWVDMVMLYSLLTSFAAGGLFLAAAFLDAISSVSHLRGTKEPLGLSTKVFWTDIIVGIFCLIAFIACFAGDHPIARLVRLLSLIGVYFVSLVMACIPSDRFDEMAQENYRQAKAKTLDILSMILLGGVGTCLIAEALFSNLFTIPRITADWASDHLVQFIVLYFGLQNIIKGLIFRKLEAN